MTSLWQKGLTLIEVMIALAVFSFGLLALAALMASGLKYNTSALHRSYATSQAYDMADRMRANRIGLDNYNSLSGIGTDPDCIKTEIGCPPNEMAQYDAWQWNCDNARLLPEGTGTVSLESSDPDIYAITVSWNDDRDPGTPDVSFIVEFQPGGDGGSSAGEPDVTDEPKCIDAEGTEFKNHGKCVSHWVHTGLTGAETKAEEMCTTCK